MSAQPQNQTTTTTVCVALEFVVSVTSLPHFEIDNKPNKIINVKAKQKVLTISKQ